MLMARTPFQARRARCRSTAGRSMRSAGPEQKPICPAVPCARSIFGPWPPPCRATAPQGSLQVCLRSVGGREIFLVADLLGDFPESHAVQIVRDPRAVIHSQRNRWRQKWLGAGHTPWRRAVANWVNYHPITASKLWLNAYRAGQQLLQHSRFTRVKYEDLLMSPDETVRKLCADLGLEFEASMLDIPQVGSSHRRHDGPGKGVVRGAADSWRGCQPHSDTWICQLMTAEARAELGYESIAVGTPILGVLVRTLLYPFHLLAMLLVNPRLALRVRSISKRQSPERR